MDFTKDSFNFRSDESDFRLQNAERVEGEYCYEKEEESRVDDDPDGPVYCYQYNKRRSTGGGPGQTSAAKSSQKDVTLKAYTKTRVSLPGQNLKQTANASESPEPIDFSKYTTPMYRRPCLGVATCPMLDQERGIKDALGKKKEYKRCKIIAKIR